MPPEAAGKAVEIWFTDEARVGQQGTLTRVWAKRGSPPRARRDRRFEWAYLFCAICPERGTGAAIIMPEVNVAAMNEHLAEISRRAAGGAHRPAGARRRRLAQLAAGQGASEYLPLPLPPYAPELNPMENVWELMRGNFLSHCVWDGYDAILEACCDAWNKLMQMTNASLHSPGAPGQNRWPDRTVGMRRTGLCVWVRRRLVNSGPNQRSVSTMPSYRL